MPIEKVVWLGHTDSSSEACSSEEAISLCLRELRDYLLGSLGPVRGTLKLFSTPAGAARCTGTSCRMVSLLQSVLGLEDASSPASYLGEAVLHLMATNRLGDGGLRFGSLLLDFLMTFRKDRTRPFDRCILDQRSLVENLAGVVGLTLEVSDLPQMLAVARSVLGSKTAILTSELEEASVEVLKAFVKSIPDGASDLQSGGPGAALEVKAVLGPKFGVKVQEGFLYQYLDPVDDLLEGVLERGPVMVLVVDLQLTMDMEDMSEVQNLKGVKVSPKGPSIAMQDQLEDLADVCVRSGVKIVANQKVVSLEAKEIFHSRGILVLERLGLQGRQRLCRLCCLKAPLQSIAPDTLDPFIGVVGSVHIHQGGVQVHDSAMLQFRSCASGPSSELVTLVVSHWNEEKLEDLKVLFNQAVDSLHEVLRGGQVVVPGAGCFEAILARTMIVAGDRGNACLAKCLYRQALASGGHLRLSEDTRTAWQDSTFGHLWTSTTGSSRCQCRLIGPETLQALVSLEGQTLRWWPIALNHTPNLSSELPDADLKPWPRSLEPDILSKVCREESVVLDILQTKVATIVSAMEAAKSLSSIGAVIFAK